MRNPGRMLVSVEEYYAGSRSKCRNPLLQNMFRFLGFGEKAGSGADIIAQGWAENHWARPTISETLIPGETELVLTLQKMKEKVKEKPKEKVKEKPKEKPKEKILSIIRENPEVTYEQLEELTGLSESSIYRHMRSLKENGILLRVDGDRGGHWEIIDKD